MRHCGALSRPPRLSIGTPVRARLSIRPWVLALVAAFAVAVGAWAEIEGATHRSKADKAAEQVRPAPAAPPSRSSDPGGSGELKSHPKVVVAVPPDQAPQPARSSADRAPSD